MVSAPLRVLVVGDDDVDRRAARRLLEDLEGRVEVHEATSFAEGLTRLPECPPDVVLLDIHPGGVDEAFAFLDAIRRWDQEVPVVVLAGQGNERVPVELLHAGAADYVPKTHLTGELLWRALRRAVDVHRAAVERRRTDAALREREALLAWVIAAAPLPLLTLDAEGRVREANEAAGGLFGVAPVALLGRSWETFVPPAERAAFADLWSAGGGRIETVVLGPGGGIIPVEVALRIFAPGAHRRAVVALRDVRPEHAAARRTTVERAVLHALAGATDENQAITAVLPALGAALDWDCALWWEPRGDVLVCRQVWAREPTRWADFVAMSRRLRLRRGQPLPGWVWERGEPLWLVDVHRVPGVRRRKVAGDLATALAVPVPLERTGLGVLELFAARAEEPDPNLLDLVRSLGVLIGRVLEQRRAERRVRRAEAIQRRLAQAGLRLGRAVGAAEVVQIALELAVAEPPAQQALLVGDASAEVAWAERLPTGEIRWTAPVPRPVDIRWAAFEEWANAAPDEGSPVPTAAISLLTELGLSLSADTVGLVAPLRARGERVGWLVALRAGAGFGAGNRFFFQELARRTAVALDQARLLHQAQQAAILRDEILAVVSHDLRNPLSAIYTSALTLLELPLDDEQRRQQLEIVRRAAERMNRLIDDLLDVSLLESGRFEIRREPVPAAPLLDELVAQYRVLAQERRIALELDIAAPLPDFWGDRDRLLQTVGNLVGNALKFTPAGGRVTVRARAADHLLRLEVEDTGTGIAPEDLPHIFDRFWQARRQRRAGVGLGLAIAKGIVEAHRGRIDVASEPGRGTTFRLELPAARPATATTLAEGNGGA